MKGILIENMQEDKPFMVNTITFYDFCLSKTRNPVLTVFNRQVCPRINSLNGTVLLYMMMF